jgi:uncharacterized protein
MGLRFNVSDLIGRTGSTRRVSGELALALRLGTTQVDDVAVVDANLEMATNVLMARIEAAVPAHLTCTRCLSEWDETIRTEIVQPYATVPDENGYGIERGSNVDLGPVVRDEIALALPAAPLCREDCLGLCPICGTDLNNAPCGGHDDVAYSRFAVLRQLLDPPS